MKVFKYANDGESAFSAAWQEGNDLGLACDMVDKKVSFSVNGSFEPPLGVDSIASAFSASGFKVVANFGTCPSKTRRANRREIRDDILRVCARCAEEIGCRQRGMKCML